MVSTFLLVQIISPLAVNIIASFIVVRYGKRGIKFQKKVLMGTAIILAIITWWIWVDTPKMTIVPDLMHFGADPADDLCKRIGLKPVLRSPAYGPCGGQVIKQSLRPGLQVYIGRKIEITISRGSPVGDYGPCL